MHGQETRVICANNTFSGSETARGTVDEIEETKKSKT